MTRLLKLMSAAVFVVPVVLALWYLNAATTNRGGDHATP